MNALFASLPSNCHFNIISVQHRAESWRRAALNLGSWEITIRGWRRSGHGSSLAIVGWKLLLCQHSVLAEGRDGLLFESLNFFVNALEILWPFLSVLDLHKSVTIWSSLSRSATFDTTSCEPGKKEGESGVFEESFLGLLAIFIHGITHNAEIESLYVWV